MQFPDSFFEDEVRDGFYVPAMMKRSWAAQLEVLEVIDQICKKHHIRWFADRGTLLGAVRHGGFIPWDDDLDICMLRDDYTRFNTVIRKELPEGFYIPESTIMGYRVLTRVCNGKSICVEKSFLEKYHGFPFVAGIDIFALDYVARDPKEEKLRKELAAVVYQALSLVSDENQHTSEIEELVSQIERLLHLNLDRRKSLNVQLFSLLEDLFGRFPASQAEEVAFMPNWIFDDNWKFPLDYYRDSVLLPFEHGELPAPIMYRDALKYQYGENYMISDHSSGGHDYPCYQTQMEQMIDALEGDPLPFEYHFSADDLKRPNSWQKKNADRGTQPDSDPLTKEIQQFLHLASCAHKDLQTAIQNREWDTAKALLQICQENAIYMGTLLEQAYGEGLLAVKFLEEYCDLTYQYYQNTEKNFDAENNRNTLDSLLEKFSNSFGNP